MSVSSPAAAAGSHSSAGPLQPVRPHAHRHDTQAAPPPPPPPVQHTQAEPAASLTQTTRAKQAAGVNQVA